MSNAKGRFGIHGGQYIPETLMNAVIELEEAYNHYKDDPQFQAELTELLNEYAGRPSRLYYAEKMTKDLGGAKIYLKREDLNHTGAHKINNVLGQALLAKKMGKTRPGIQALKELGIVSPLAELHITKAEVKAMAKEWGISVASRPSTPCMATRLPYNTPIDYDVMKQIEVGEGYLRELLGGNVRLRLHGNVVRIEADKTSFGKLLEHGDEIVKTLKNLGFVYITMDLEGFRSGSMDVGLDK